MAQSYKAPVAKSALYTATLQSMAQMGTAPTADRESGMVVTTKGNWTITAIVKDSGKSSSVVDISCRYAPGSRMDFNSREGLTKDLADRISNTLGKALIPA